VQLRALNAPHSSVGPISPAPVIHHSRQLTQMLPTKWLLFIYFASAAVAVDSSHRPMTASSSASWSRFSPPSNFVNGHVSTMWFMVCRWPQSQECDWARPLCETMTG